MAQAPLLIFFSLQTGYFIAEKTKVVFLLAFLFCFDFCITVIYCNVRVKLLTKLQKENCNNRSFLSASKSFICWGGYCKSILDPHITRNILTYVKLTRKKKKNIHAVYMNWWNFCPHQLSDSPTTEWFYKQTTIRLTLCNKSVTHESTWESEAVVVKAVLSSKTYSIYSTAVENIPRDLQFTLLLEEQSSRLGKSPPLDKYRIFECHGKISHSQWAHRTAALVSQWPSQTTWAECKALWILSNDFLIGRKT